MKNKMSTFDYVICTVGAIIVFIVFVEAYGVDLDWLKPWLCGLFIIGMVGAVIGRDKS